MGPSNELISKANEGNERACGAQESFRRNLENASLRAPRGRGRGRGPPRGRRLRLGAPPPPAAPRLSPTAQCGRPRAPGRRTPAPPGPDEQHPHPRPRPPGAGRRRRRAAGRAQPRPRVPGSARTAPPRAPTAPGTRGALPLGPGAPALGPRPSALGPGPAARQAGPHSPSLAFFLRASVPPSFPKKESSFFRDGGDLGVGDLGTEGDFCGDVAMAAERAAARGPAGTRSWRWAGAAGLRLRLSKRKRNYSKHLRQLTLAFPFPLSLPRAALRPGRSCALGVLGGSGLHPRPLTARSREGAPNLPPCRPCGLVCVCM